MKINKRKSIDFALQQMVGFKVGKWQDIEDLILSMGLTKKEWIIIKKEKDSGHLDEDDIKFIDEHFALAVTDVEVKK